MAARIVNLRMRRKQKARDDKTALADTNAVKHGRSKGEKAAAQAEEARSERHLDGHRRDVQGPDLNSARSEQSTDRDDRG